MTTTDTPRAADPVPLSTTSATVTVCTPRGDSCGEFSIIRVPLADAWLIWSYEHNAWWGPEYCGYYTNVLSAGLYTQDAAYAESEPHTPGARPLEEPRRLVDALACSRYQTMLGGEMVAVLDTATTALAAAREAERDLSFALDVALGGMREPMTLDDAQSVRSYLVGVSNERKKRAVRAARAAATPTEAPRDAAE